MTAGRVMAYSLTLVSPLRRLSGIVVWLSVAASPGLQVHTHVSDVFERDRGKICHRRRLRGRALEVSRVGGS
jgi:hypothetical protein